MDLRGRQMIFISVPVYGCLEISLDENEKSNTQHNTTHHNINQDTIMYPNIAQHSIA